VLVAADAAWCARRQPAAYTLRRYNRWWVYLLALAGVVLANLVLRAELESGVHAFTIQSGSMAPTLLRGDYVMFASAPAALPRGTVVAYRSDADMVVHRVVGVPGDVLEMRGGHLRVNGREVREPYAVRTPALAVPPGNMEWQRDAYVGADSAAYAPTMYEWGPLRVPEERYFVMGDNRGETIDSRITGFVDRQDIVYRASWIYYSKGEDGWRWSRFGRSVR
jgi:signal peptidase I